MAEFIENYKSSGYAQAAKTDRPIGSVQDRVNAIGNIADRLHAVLDKLEDRAAPVVSPVEPMVNNDKTGESFPCKLAQDLNAHAQRLAYVVDRIDSFMRRLQV